MRAHYLSSAHSNYAFADSDSKAFCAATVSQQGAASFSIFACPGERRSAMHRHSSLTASEGSIPEDLPGRIKLAASRAFSVRVFHRLDCSDDERECMFPGSIDYPAEACFCAVQEAEQRLCHMCPGASLAFVPVATIAWLGKDVECRLAVVTMGA